MPMECQINDYHGAMACLPWSANLMTTKAMHHLERKSSTKLPIPSTNTATLPHPPIPFMAKATKTHPRDATQDMTMDCQCEWLHLEPPLEKEQSPASTSNGREGCNTWLISMARLVAAAYNCSHMSIWIILAIFLSRQFLKALTPSKCDKSSLSRYSCTSYKKLRS